MINTIFLGFESEQLHLLRAKIGEYCPNLSISKIVNAASEIPVLLALRDPSLIFINTDNPQSDTIWENKVKPQEALEAVFVSNHQPNHIPKRLTQSLGYLFSPFSGQELIRVVENARSRIQKRIEAKKNQLLVEKLLADHKANELIGIPTLDGYKFIHTQSIIRCEGLQKCTHVITADKSDIISSYNIGQFKNLLEPYGFFSPHKSHLINLAFMKEYKREGTIIFTDGSYAPVSKRKKSEFLQRITHL